MTSIGVLNELLKRSGEVRTDMYCHSCDEQKISPNTFIATIDHDIDGNHEIECPRCGHIHFRVIKDGLVTEQRYNSGYPTHKVERRNVWKSNTTPGVTASVASSFIRDSWLNRG